MSRLPAGVGVLVLLGLFAACSSSPAATGDSPEPAAIVREETVPRFDPAAGELAELVGTTFVDTTGSNDAINASLGVEDGLPHGGALVGATIEDDPAARTAIHWVEFESTVDFVVITPLAEGDRVESAWTLTRSPDTILMFGQDACRPPLDTFDWESGMFLTVVNQAQDEALGAWTMTPEGPVIYDQMDELNCIPFVP